MATAEDKLDGLAAQMKSMLGLMEAFNRWRPEVDSFASDLSKDVKQLTSRVEMLEAQPKTAPSLVPPREEEGRAKGLGVESTTQGLDTGTLVLPPPLANGQCSGSLTHPIPMLDPSLNYHAHAHPHFQREVRLRKAVFPKFDGANPKS